MDGLKVGVIAGTPVDTQMGVDFLNSKSIKALGYAVSSCPEEQSKLQILSAMELEEKIRGIIRDIKKKNITKIIIYCNSLSTAVDMDKLSCEEQIKIITPLHVYKEVAARYENIGVLTANNQSAAGIERAIQSINPGCNVIGVGILPLVVEIEKGAPASDIVTKFSLGNIMNFYDSLSVDAVFLGCTHFSCLYDELKRCTSLPVFDPAELMYSMIWKN